MPLPKVLIEAPAVEPSPFGILSAALVRDSTDPHEYGGVTWESPNCGTAYATEAACNGDVSGAWAVSVNSTGLATITASVNPPGTPEGDYIIDWGDGDTDTVDSGTLDGTTHQYAAPGAYTVTVTRTDPSQGVYSTPGTVTVTAGQATGPFPVPFTYRASKATTDGRGWVEADPFTLFLLHTCRLVGDVDPEGYARKALIAAEGYGIEDRLGQVFSADADVILNDTEDGPVVALGALERIIRGNYNGTGVIYADPEVATALISLNLLRVDGAVLRTILGTRVVVFAGGYGYTPVGGGNSQYMWATGAVVVTRSPVETYPRTLANPRTNEALTLAERGYSVGWECFLAAQAVNPAGVTP